MHPLRWLLAFIVLMMAMAALPGRVAASGDLALVRYMLASPRFDSMSLEIDGRVVLRQPANVLGAYIAIQVDRPRSLALYGSFMADPPVLVRSINRYQPSTGDNGLAIFADDGTLVQPDATSATPPAGQAVLRPILAAPAKLSRAPTLRWGSLVFDYVSGAGDRRVNQTVVPRTERLELLASGTGKVVQTEYLRVQPGFRYEIVVVPGAGGMADSFKVTAVSPQLIARPTQTRVFDETGHVLEGRFRSYWEINGALPVFGLPLNDDRLQANPEGQFVAQVFERNRFEYHPEKPAPYDVLLGRLGEEALRRQGRDWRKEYASRPIESGCDAVVTDGRQFAVCEPFRSYYRAHGLDLDGRPGYSPAESLALFGLPLTQARLETNSSGDRVLTQWFERARFEYHPGNPPGQQVLLGRLGAEVYDLRPLTFDDEDRGFMRRSPAGGPDWQEATGGFGGHYWWTCAPNRDMLAGWIAGSFGPRTTDGYDVEVFIPGNNANSRKARYSLSEGQDMAPSEQLLNQKPYSNEWVPLGRVGQLYGLLVQSGTGETGGCTYQIAVDAMRLIPRGRSFVKARGNIVSVTPGARPLIGLGPETTTGPRAIVVDPTRLYFTDGERATLADLSPGVQVEGSGPLRGDGALEAESLYVGLTVAGRVAQVGRPTRGRTLVTLTGLETEYGYVAIIPNTRLVFASTGRPATAAELKLGTRLVAYGVTAEGGTVEARKVVVGP